MKAIIITIGDEILYGQTIDTNSAWMGRQLGAEGVKIVEINSISDQAEAITESLERCIPRADLILITGGLGPTKDDITKKTLAEFFDDELVEDESIKNHLIELFQLRNPDLIEKNRCQTLVPSKCEVLVNDKGTAPGMLFRHQGKLLVSMPGVPHEMKGIVTNQLMPILRKEFDLPFILHKHILTAGIPEVLLSSRLEKFEEQLPEEVKLAYLPNLGRVKLRLTASANDEETTQRVLKEQTALLKEQLEGDYYGEDAESLEQNIGKLLLERGQRFGTAESCTGGYVAHLITENSGASQYFDGTVVSYSNSVKVGTLGVKASTLEQFGAVSEQCVQEMVTGLCKQLNTDYGIAISGVAGPSGGSEEKPVGTVWIAVGNASEIKSKRFQFTKHRSSNIRLSATVALEMFRRYLIKQEF